MAGRRAAVVLAAAMALASCGGGAAASATEPSPGPSSPTALGPQGPDDVTLRVERRGGFAPPVIPPVPSHTLYADGHLVTADPPTEQEPAIQTLRVRTLAPAALARVRAAAHEARLDEGDYADQPMPDAIVTVVTYRHDGRVDHSAFATLDPRPQDTADQADRRRRAAAYLAALTDVERLAGPDGVSAAEGLRPDRLAGSVRPRLAGGTTPVKAWPVPSVPLAPLADAGPCAVLRGSDAAAVEAGLADERADTAWLEGARTWRVLLRPLLPDQGGCPTQEPPEAVTSARP